MYFVAFGRDLVAENAIETSEDNLKFATSLEEAESFRVVSGDLVFHADTMKIVKSEDWLFWWEREDSKGYAKGCIKKNVSLKVRRY